MSYEIRATSDTPALIIFLLDISASMQLPLEDSTRIEVVTKALRTIFKQMINRSTKGESISPRYHMAMIAYSDQPRPVINGIESITTIAQLGVPKLRPEKTTNTAAAFAAAESLLQQTLGNYTQCPAPIVCHLTDGEYTGDDPEPGARRIMQMQVPDGPVLIENIFLSDTVLPNKVTDVKMWPGILPTTPLANEHAEKLRAISSPLPETYRVMMLESGYHMQPGALMLLPGTSLHLVTMGFAMSTITR